MANGIETSIFALKALSNRQSVSANNLANSIADDYKATTSHLEEGATGNVHIQTAKDESPGGFLTEPDGELHQTSNVDMARELTDMIPTQTAYSANLKALKVTDEMAGTLLDLKA